MRWSSASDIAVRLALHRRRVRRSIRERRSPLQCWIGIALTHPARRLAGITSALREVSVSRFAGIVSGQDQLIPPPPFWMVPVDALTVVVEPAWFVAVT